MQKLSETVEWLAMGVTAGLSRKDIQEKLKAVTPEDIAEVARILKSPSEKILTAAGRAPGVVALLLILSTFLGTALADTGIRKDIGADLLKLKTKGEVTFQDLDDFKRDLPPATEGGEGDPDVDKINKLIADLGEELTVQEQQKAKGFQPQIVNVGNERLMADNPKEFAALRAISGLVDKLGKQKHLDKPGYEKKVKALARAFKLKKPINFA
jgi:hypothetical protein